MRFCGEPLEGTTQSKAAIQHTPYTIHHTHMCTSLRIAMFGKNVANKDAFFEEYRHRIPCLYLRPYYTYCAVDDARDAADITDDIELFMSMTVSAFGTT